MNNVASFVAFAVTASLAVHLLGKIPNESALFHSQDMQDGQGTATEAVVAVPFPGGWDVLLEYVRWLWLRYLFRHVLPTRSSPEVGQSVARVWLSLILLGPRCNARAHIAREYKWRPPKSERRLLPLLQSSG